MVKVVFPLVWLNSFGYLPIIVDMYLLMTHCAKFVLFAAVRSKTLGHMKAGHPISPSVFHWSIFALNQSDSLVHAAFEALKKPFSDTE